jgi:hypothetical protein
MVRKLVRLGHLLHETQTLPAETANGDASYDQHSTETQASDVVAGSPTPVRKLRRFGHTNAETQGQNAGATNKGRVDHDHLTYETHNRAVVIDPAHIQNFTRLKIMAEMFSDVQEARKSVFNRATNPNVPVDPLVFKAELDRILLVEKDIGDRLQEEYQRIVPPGVRAWQEANQGMGPHLVARLLGHLGHPRIALPAHWEGGGAKRKLIYDPPFERTLSELWQYAGHGESMRRQRGMTAEDVFSCGSPMVKMLVHLLAEAGIKERGRDKSAWQYSVVTKPKGLPTARRNVSRSSEDAKPMGQPTGIQDGLDGQQLFETQEAHAVEAVHPTSRSSRRTKPISLPTGNETPGGLDGHGPIETQTSCAVGATWPYRRVYEARRRVTLNRVHAEPCVRCGPSGHPAQAGSPWSDAHRHADALRIVGKAILRDLWLAAR